MRAHAWRWPVVVLGLLAGTGAAPQWASAQKKKVVVLPFSGPSGKAAQNALQQSIRRRTVAIPAKKYLATAEELGVDPHAAQGISTVCSRLKCDAVITGKVTRKKRRFQLVVTVHNGGNGDAVGRRAATVRGARRVGQAGAAIGRRCMDLVAQGRAQAVATAPRVAPPPPASPPPPTPAARRADTSDIPGFEVTKTMRSAGKKDRDDEDRDDEEETRVRARPSRRAKWETIFDVSAAVGVALRRAVVEPANPAQALKYEGGMYPEFVLRLDAYPLTPWVHSLANGLGLGVSFARHILISTSPENNPDASVGTSSQELCIDLKWRWQILRKPTSPQVLVLAGYGMRDFNLDPNPTLTSFNYRFIRFGLDGSIPFGTPFVGFTGGVDVRVVMNVGQQAVDSFGSKDGGLGYAFRAGLAGRYTLSKGAILYFATFEYLRFTMKFAGLEAGLEDRPDRPDTFEPTSGSDRYVRIWAGGGYAF